MYKRMIPADKILRQPDPTDQSGGHPPMNVTDLEQRFEEQRGHYLRLAADFENFKKRSAEEVERRAMAHKQALARDLLPVFDNLDRALSNSADLTHPIRQGVEMTYRQFIDSMRKHGFAPREDLGKAFDPNYHQAACTRKEPGRGHHTILEVWQRGWMQDGKMFRAATVVVNDLDAAVETDPSRREGELSHV